MIHLTDAKRYVSDSYDRLNAKPQVRDEYLGILRHGDRVLIIIDEDMAQDRALSSDGARNRSFNHFRLWATL